MSVMNRLKYSCGVIYKLLQFMFKLPVNSKFENDLRLVIKSLVQFWNC